MTSFHIVIILSNQPYLKSNQKKPPRQKAAKFKPPFDEEFERSFTSGESSFYDKATSEIVQIVPKCPNGGVKH